MRSKDATFKTLERNVVLGATEESLFVGNSLEYPGHKKQTKPGWA